MDWGTSWVPPNYLWELPHGGSNPDVDPAQVTLFLLVASGESRNI